MEDWKKQKVKEWLWSYKRSMANIKRYQDKLHDLRLKMSTCRGFMYSDMPKGGGGHSDLSDYIVALEIQEELLMSEVLKAKVQKDKILSLLNKLPKFQHDVVHCHYIRGMTWGDVALRNKISERTVFNYHTRALETLWDLGAKEGGFGE